ncbi:hypothetical protein OROMI_008655 [Orobanche minor]
MCDETRARIRILEGPLGIPDRIVLISGEEEPDAIMSPAMDAAVRVYKRVSGLSEGEGDSTSIAIAGAAFCSIRLLVASSQAINLIGKQGSVIKSIQENTGTIVRVLPEEELPSYATSEEIIIEIHGEALKVLSALEAVIGHLRKFLVDHSVISIFEKTYNATISQEHPIDARADKTQPQFHSAPAPQIVIGSDYSLSLKRDPSIYDRETLLEPQNPQSALSLYGQDSAFGAISSTGPTGLGRTTAPVVTQEFISNRKEATPGLYGKMDAGYNSYSQVPETSYSSSSFASHLGGYGSSSLGRYGSPGLGGYSTCIF